MEQRNKKGRAGQALYAVLFAELLTILFELSLSVIRPGHVGTAPKHLIHFLLMLILVVGAGLLGRYSPPFQKVRAWLERNLMNADTRKLAIEICYAVLAGVMIFHHFYVMLYSPAVTAGALKFSLLWVFLAVLTVLMGKTWRDRGFLLVALLFSFTFERLYLKNLMLSGNDLVYFFTAVYAVFFVYGIFFVLRPSLRMPFLRVICALWSLGIMALGISGLYTAWTGISVQNLAGGKNTVLGDRLTFFANPNSNVSAGIIACGTAMALIGFSLEKKKIFKFIYLIICAVTILAVSLTSARSSFMMIAFLIAGMICLFLRQLWSRLFHVDGGRKKLIPAALLLLLCFAICFFAAVEVQRQLSGVFMKVRDRGGIVPVAQAEGTEEVVPTETDIPLPSFVHRDAWVTSEEEMNRILTGRYEIWLTTFSYIREHPDVLLTGLSVDGSAAVAGGRNDHVHNILLQMLVENGIPGLFLFLALLFYFIRHMLRLWWEKDLPFWQRMLPLPVLAILLQEMAECLTHFSYGHPPVTVFWFFMGCTIAVSKSIGKNEDFTSEEKEMLPAGMTLDAKGE